MSHIHIDVRELCFAYDAGEMLLREINFHAAGHESIGIIGANGAGKSTLLKLLAGLEFPASGSIRVEEIPVEPRTLALVREKIGYVFQDSECQLFMPTVYDDVAFAPRNYGLPEEEVERRVTHALAQAGIAHLREKQICKMSGGEKKLVSLATILSLSPDIILMDEPSAALDPRHRRQLINILNGLGHLKIIATHDLDLVWDTCPRTLLLAHGRIVADGSTRAILTDKKLLENHGLELPLSLSRA